MVFDRNNFFRTNDIYGTPRDIQIPKPSYHIFITIPSGWPIIVPGHMKEYKIMVEKTYVYEHILEGSAEQCIQRQLEILNNSFITPRQPLG